MDEFVYTARLASVFNLSLVYLVTQLGKLVVLEIITILGHIMYVPILLLLTKFSPVAPKKWVD